MCEQTYHLSADNYGPKPELMRWAYTAVVRPAVTYACVNWGRGHKLGKKGFEAKLQKLDRLAMLTLTRIHKSTPTKGLNIIYNIMPLKLYIEFTGAKAYARQYNQLQENWSTNSLEAPGKINHRQYWKCRMENFAETDMDTDSCKLANWATRFTVCTDSFSGEAKFLNS